MLIYYTKRNQKPLYIRVWFAHLCPHLVVDQKFYGVVPPLDEHQFVGLSGCRVGERSPQPGPDAGLHPKAQGQSEDLLQESPLHPSVHVVGPHREADLEGIKVLGMFPVGSCGGRFKMKNLVIKALAVRL